MTTLLKIGFIGGGMMAQVGHLPFYLNDPRCDVVSVCETRPSLITALRDIYCVPSIVALHDDILSDPNIDAVMISVPRGATGPLTLAALQAGKHVIAEKPMAHTYAQGIQLTEMARLMKCHYSIGFMKRYDAGIQKAKVVIEDLIKENALGPMISARFYNFSAEYTVAPPSHVRPSESRQIRFPVWPFTPDWLDPQYHESYVWFMNAIIHDVNLMRFFFGNNISVNSAVLKKNNGLVAICTVNNIPITLEAAKTAAGKWIEGVDFIFEKGCVHVEIPSPMASDKVSEISIDAKSSLVADSIKPAEKWCFECQATSFLDAMVEDRPSVTNGEDSLNDLLLAELIWKNIGLA